MNFKKLPILGAPIALAYFLSTADALAKDLDAQTLAKMSEAPAVRVACGVADVSFITPAAENGSAFIGGILTVAIALGTIILLAKKGVRVPPVVSWILPLLVVVPTLFMPVEMANLMALPFAYAGFGQSSIYAPLIIFAASAVVLTCKTVRAIARMFSFSDEHVAYPRISPRKARNVSYQKERVSEETYGQLSQPVFCEFTSSLDVETARANFERTYNNGIETKFDEADDTTCLSR